MPLRSRTCIEVRNGKVQAVDESLAGVDSSVEGITIAMKRAGAKVLKRAGIVNGEELATEVFKMMMEIKYDRVS